MAQRLTNDELAERVRASNRRRGERHRQRLTVAGRAALTVWVPVELRSRFVDRAAELLININELAERLLSAALANPPVLEPPPAAAPPTFDLIPPSVDSSPDRDATIVALHSTGLSLAQISGKLATMGILSANGCPVSVSTINRVLTANGLKANGELMGKNLIERD
mgnify:CR=1 FL=1